MLCRRSLSVLLLLFAVLGAGAGPVVACSIGCLTLPPVPGQEPEPQPAPDSQTAPAPPPSPHPAPAPQPAPAARPSVAEEAAAMLAMVNATRSDHGLRPLATRDDVTEIARAHSHAMADSESIWHNDNYFTKATKARLGASHVGENVAVNATTTDAHNRLMNSPGHRANILDPNFTHVGIAIARRDGTSSMYFTQDFFKSTTPPVKATPAPTPTKETSPTTKPTKSAAPTPRAAATPAVRRAAPAPEAALARPDPSVTVPGPDAVLSGTDTPDPAPTIATIDGTHPPAPARHSTHTSAAAAALMVLAAGTYTTRLLLAHRRHPC